MQDLDGGKMEIPEIPTESRRNNLSFKSKHYDDFYNSNRTFKTFKEKGIRMTIQKY